MSISGNAGGEGELQFTLFEDEDEDENEEESNAPRRPLVKNFTK